MAGADVWTGIALPPLASSLDVVLLGVLAAVALLFLLAYFTRIPYPIWLTAGGATLGFVPGLPVVELAPELVLVLFLPPLLTSAAYYSSIRDLRFNARPIALLSIGLALATTAAVAAVAHLVTGMSWETAFVLGAVLGPTDPVAATVIAGRVGAPRRVVTVLEGESLINGATALIAFRFAVGAVVAGTFLSWTPSASSRSGSWAVWQSVWPSRRRWSRCCGGSTTRRRKPSSRL